MIGENFLSHLTQMFAQVVKIGLNLLPNFWVTNSKFTPPKNSGKGRLDPVSFWDDLFSGTTLCWFLMVFRSFREGISSFWMIFAWLNDILRLIPTHTDSKQFASLRKCTWMSQEVGKRLRSEL